MAEYEEIENLINKEYEQTLLGAILIDSTVMPLVAPILNANDFGINQHVEIFEAMKLLYLEDSPIDMVSTHTKIRETHGDMTQTSALYLAQLGSAVPNTVNSLYYARKIKELASKRDMIKYFSTIKYDRPLQDIVLGVRQKLDKTHIAEATQTLVESIDLDEIERVANFRTFHTHFPTFNQSARITAGELITLVGDVSKGKTTFALNLAMDIAKSGGKIQFFTLDMTDIQLLARIASMVYKIPSMELMPDSPDFASNIIKAYETDLAKHLILESRTAYLSDMIGKIRAANPDVVIVDYVQNVNVDGVSNSVDILNRVLISLRIEAQDRPIIILSQVSKGEGGYMERAKGSSTIAQASSLVVEIDAEAGQFKYRIRKNRTVGIVTGWVNLNFDYWNFSEEI